MSFLLQLSGCTCASLILVLLAEVRRFWALGHCVVGEARSTESRSLQQPSPNEQTESEILRRL